MFKELLRGITSFFTSDKILILVVFLVLILVLSMYSGSKSSRLDAMSNLNRASSSSYVDDNAHVQQSLDNSSSLPASVNHPDTLSSVGESASVQQPSSVANPSDLLPVDQNSQWASLNPVNSGNIAMPDLLQAGYHIGLDTIGQTLRNANLQLRSDPIIPKQETGPWLQSTIEPDYGRVPLEIGPVSR